jgi:hypothetical protein
MYKKDAIIPAIASNIVIKFPIGEEVADMWITKFFKPSFLEQIRSPQHRLAWMIAVVADALQLAAFPFFAEGGVSPLDTALDVIVAVALTRVLGWHWAFLPSFATELVPGLDLVPTWTAAVFFVTRSQVAANSQDNISPSVVQPDGSEVMPPGPAPAPRT